MSATTHVLAAAPSPAGPAVPATEHLHDGWSLRAVAGPVPAEIAGRTVPATVPGSTHTDLLDAGLIPDPYLDLNEKTLVWMHRTHWRYHTSFAARPAAPDERVDLVFEGLDTVATVELNGDVVARTANQHRSYRVDVRDLVAGHNDLAVTFAPALEHAEALEAEQGHLPRPYPHPFAYVRKMACSFGWDWGPDLQTAGIGKPVRLERWRTARLAQVRPLVTVDADGAGRAEVHVEIERSGLGADVPLIVTASVAGRQAEVTSEVTAQVTVPAGATTAVVTVVVPDVERWWPVGYGRATLHDLTVRLADADGASDPDAGLGTWRRRIGFRSVVLDRGVDQYGTAFTFVINDVPVFVKGANWIPDDHLLTRIDRARLDRRMRQALGANLNLLRVWGGGSYETEDFYDLADEHGLLVWQDFLFACAAYPEVDPIAAEIEAEARENVARLTPHASLVLWNGGNETLWGAADWGWSEHLQGRAWGLRYYTEVLPDIVAELDPTRPYSDNSPYSHGFTAGEKHPNDPDHGTHHEWQCWNTRDYAHYRDDIPRFCSEFGWQAPATWATLTRAVPVAALDKESESFLLHQKAEDGNGKLDRGLAPHLPVPADFEDWHWATSLNQARAVAFAIEHYRSWWPRTAGSIVWQLNDCWPVTSWAAIDSDERKKPLWYALRAASANRLVTVQPRGDELVAVFVNDTDVAGRSVVVAQRTGLDGVVLATVETIVQVPARGTATVPLPVDLVTPDDATRELLVVTASVGDGVVRGIHLFAPDKDVAYEADPFTTEVVQVAGGYRVDVSARSLVRDLALLADKVAPDAEVDDQLVTLLAGQSVSFTVRTAAQVDPAALTSPRVLRSANALVVAG
ncbi:glycoside hydrolase family 2 protein [Cellulomonas sp. KRMCY2]|uniref:glycoside hydrolase family 2 protein n=1 Tax=Cellulomonas sp. KRMCY2 TaxID=1304865 RepID=UPI00045EA97F|nr:beta-mannosidase [Cellulomonas sp. KRMCY2]